jgi:hypothetical protein
LGETVQRFAPGGCEAKAFEVPHALRGAHGLGGWVALLRARAVARSGDGGNVPVHRTHWSQRLGGERDDVARPQAFRGPCVEGDVVCAPGRSLDDRVERALEFVVAPAARPKDAACRGAPHGRALPHAPRGRGP